MADDVMDSGERTEAALAAFSGEGEQQQDDGQQQQRVDGQQDGQQQVDGQQQQQQQDGKLTDEQIQADPRFQELSTLRDDITNAFSDFPGLVGEDGKVNVQEATLQLKDASILYDIMQGRGTPSGLLEVMAKNGGWSDQQKQLVANDLIGWLTKAGYLKDGAAGSKKPGDPGFKDPIDARLDKIENDRKTEQQRADQQRVAQHQEKVYRDNFLPAVEKLCKQKQVPQEDFAQYVEGIASRVRGNKAVIARIEKGNYVDVQKFFTEIYNAEVKRLERWTKSQTKAADAKSKNPKIPAGGASPHPAGSAKTVNARDRDSRIAAATEML